MVHLRFHQSFHWRVAILIGFFSILLVAIGVRVFALAIIEHRRFVLAAEQQQQFSEVIPSRRGTISFQDKRGALQPVALRKSSYTLIAAPNAIPEPDVAAAALAPFLPDADVLASKLGKREDPHEILAKRLDATTAERIRALNLEGITLLEQSRRSYPYDALASSLLGFVSYADDEARGVYGIEQEYESYLKGERGFFAGERGADGYWVAVGRRILNPPVDGDSLVLTIDSNIQFAAERELEQVMERWAAPSGSVLVIEPKTGRILAFASKPAFNPNEYEKTSDYANFRAPIVDAQFELGSVMKPITMAAGVNDGVVTATTTYRDAGAVAFPGGAVVRNFDLQAHGTRTMTQVLEQSLNTGAIFVQQRLGKERFRDYLTHFGFGQVSGIDLPGEVPGDLSNLAAGRDVDHATAAFGQGIAVTPLQTATALAAIANGGMLMRPYVVERIVDASGNVEQRRPREVRRVVSSETAETVTKMLVSVVRNGFDNRAAVPGYFVAAKTGTAQIPLAAKPGYSDEVIHTFVGYAPAFEPRFLALIQVNRPQGNRFAANTLTPAFRNLAEFILHYYEVPPDER